MRRFLPLVFCAAAPLCSSNFLFIEKDHPIHFEAEARVIAPADFRKEKYKHSDVNYSDGNAMLFLSYCLDSSNSLSLGLGYRFLRFDWDANPRFRESNYHLADINLTWVSTSLNCWRWVTTLGASIDPRDADFHDTGVIYGVLWGRYTFSNSLAGHIGAFGFTGIKNTYGLPIIGFDWQITRCLRLHAIYPIDISMRMYLNRNWYLSLEYATFGPWRYPWRAREGIGAYDKAIFNVYSTGGEFNLNYTSPCHLDWGLGLGWNFGGWIHIKDKNNNHGNYFKYKGAPYGRGYFAFNF